MTSWTDLLRLSDRNSITSRTSCSYEMNSRMRLKTRAPVVTDFIVKMVEFSADELLLGVEVALHSLSPGFPGLQLQLLLASIFTMTLY